MVITEKLKKKISSHNSMNDKQKELFSDLNFYVTIKLLEKFNKNHESSNYRPASNAIELMKRHSGPRYPIMHYACFDGRSTHLLWDAGIKPIIGINIYNERMNLIDFDKEQITFKNFNNLEKSQKFSGLIMGADKINMDSNIPEELSDKILDATPIININLDMHSRKYEISSFIWYDNKAKALGVDYINFQ